jgi:ribulose bisphosphate carboxylase small subunit
MKKKKTKRCKSVKREKNNWDLFKTTNGHAALRKLDKYLEETKNVYIRLLKR